MSTATGRAVFFDRDGVLNQAHVRDGKPYPPAGVEELKIFSHVAPLLRQLKQRGFHLVVVTNQPDVGRGKQTAEAVEAIHRAIGEALPIDAFFSCFHDDRDGCDCRKPKPGMLVQAARKFDIDPHRSYMIGDRWRDMDAAAAIGCRTVWIDYRYDERGPSLAPDARVASIDEAAEWILRDSAPEDKP